MKFAYQETAFVTVAIVAILFLQGVTSQPEWHRLDDAVYLVDTITLTGYDQAQARCQGYGANLARIDSDEIQDFLTTFITPALKDTRCFWIGCNDREVEGQFRWLDGTPVIYDGWAPNEPNNDFGDQNCTCLWSSRRIDRHGRWDDANCSLNRNFICQKGFSLPELQTGPTVGEISTSSSVTVFWISWIHCLDFGDGPVVGYVIYQQTMGEEWIVVGRIDSGVGEGNLQRIMEFVLTELEPGTEYNISVSAVREGPGGEGPRSPLVTVTTPTLECQYLKKTIAVLVVLIVTLFLGNIILAIAMVIVCKRKQKKEDLPRLHAAPLAGDPQSPHYELPQPSGVRQHASQGFSGSGISNIQEGVYADIDDPERVEYVNIPSGVQK